ncbi:DUF3883 domain-containing protein [Chloroflexota bacterium]
MIKPIELANVCAIFPSLRTSRLSRDYLKKLVQDTKLIDSDDSVDSILLACVDSELLSTKSDQYYLTQKGRRLSRNHKQPGYQLSEKAKDTFIKHVLLDIESEKWCCGEFISQFDVDTFLGTFVYFRNKAIKDDTRWLITLSSVGLIEVDYDKAIINPNYLGIINQLFLKIRNPIHTKILNTENEKKEVGDLAELLALQHERARLTSAGLSVLAPLVEHISTVDQSAGYDIRSFTGTEHNPDENIFIEVKGTKMAEFSFVWSFNEINVAKAKTNNYWIYGYTKVNTNNQTGDGPITIQNPISNLEALGFTTIPLDHYVTQ